MKRKPQINLDGVRWRLRDDWPARAQLLDPALEKVVGRMWYRVHCRIPTHVYKAVWGQLADDPVVGAGGR